MSAKILSGKDVAAVLLGEMMAHIKEIDPKLVVVQVGDDPASASYIKQKLKSCEEVGMRNEHIHLPEHTSLEELLNLTKSLNTDLDVSGYIIQLPLPKHLEASVPEVIRTIYPLKDVDGFGAYNLGKMFLSKEFEHLPPATPSGIITMLEFYNIPIEGKHAVIIGRSNIVGKPLAIMLLNRGATVTICHSKTKNLEELVKQGDIVCSAVGKKNLITKDMVKKGAVVIDVGMNRDEKGLHGDVDFENVKEVASAITPVPGGVGPMTVASLIRNCVRAKQRQLEKK